MPSAQPNTVTLVDLLVWGSRARLGDRGIQIIVRREPDPDAPPWRPSLRNGVGLTPVDDAVVRMPRPGPIYVFLERTLVGIIPPARLDSDRSEPREFEGRGALEGLRTAATSRAVLALLETVVYADDIALKLQQMRAVVRTGSQFG